MWLVKKIIPHNIVTPVKHIFNTSLQKGIFPDGMRIAWVIPLFKNGDKKELTNYRPVSLLPHFSNILKANVDLGKIDHCLINIIGYIRTC